MEEANKKVIMAMATKEAAADQEEVFKGVVEANKMGAETRVIMQLQGSNSLKIL